MQFEFRRSRGFSLIEVIMTFAVALVLFSLTVPMTLDAGIRARVDVGLSITGEAQEALLKTCEANESAIVSSNLDAGYFYIPSGGAPDYVNRIMLEADCANDSMSIVLWTVDTGAETDPVLELSVNLSTGDTWTCHVILGDLNHVPELCRNRYQSI